MVNSSAIAALLTSLGEQHPDVAQSLNNLAGLCYKQGRYEEAGVLDQQAIAIATQTLGPDHPNTRTIQQNYQAMHSGNQSQSIPWWGWLIVIPLTPLIWLYLFAQKLVKALVQLLRHR